MSGPKGPHHRGTYHVQARHIRNMAYANPNTRCWRCGRTLQQHPPGAKWTAGHLTDSQPGGPLAPEASSCNYRAGQHARTRNETSEQW